MRTMKSLFGLVGAAIPVLYCGGLVIYFAGVERWTGAPVGDALNPTIYGLGAIGLLFLVPLVLKVLRLAGVPGTPRSGGGGRADEAERGEPGDFDPDAALARYLARRPPGAPGSASPPACFGAAGPPDSRHSAARGPETLVAAPLQLAR